ncbi:MAG: YceI family protein [Wenzhouxiangellaceae bacterium]
MNRWFQSLIVSAALVAGATAAAPLHAVERYVIDTRGAHAFIQFRIPHLGFSWLYGRFNDFEGEFTFDPEDPSNSSVQIKVQTASIDSNHQRRDDHLRNEDFLTVEEFPVAEFNSTAFTPAGGDAYTLEGELTFMGQTRPITIEVTQIGAGEDPWGGYRRGFEGSTSLTLADWGIDYDLGPSAREVELTLSIEGIRQDA